MIEIPGGRARIGLAVKSLEETWKGLQDTLVERSWILKEVPQHEVEIAPFRMAQYLVTQSEYLDYLKDSHEKEVPTSWVNGGYPLNHANHPVHTISPEAAERYCTWLSQKTRRKFRLPTEVEWEYAAASPDELEYPWGMIFDPKKANTIETGIGTATPVGIFYDGRNRWGNFDLAGNVEEIVSTDYTPYPGGVLVTDQFAKRRSPYRMTRGGAFNRHRDAARCKRRHGWYPDTQAIGFRLAESIESST